MSTHVLHILEGNRFASSTMMRDLDGEPLLSKRAKNHESLSIDWSRLLHEGEIITSATLSAQGIAVGDVSIVGSSTEFMLREFGAKSARAEVTITTDMFHLFEIRINLRAL